MNSTLLDLEHLQKLVYERSKTWSSFLEEVAEKETLEEVDINYLEDIYGPECDENDMYEELASMEDDESDDLTVDSVVLRNVSNTTRFSLMFNNKTLALPQGRNSEENKFIDILNQTLPIINENNRQLKESGLDEILSSFDKKKIEDKVGSWLSRHNSLFGGDNTLLCSAVDKDYKKERRVKPKAKHVTDKSISYKNTGYNEACSDSDDSLQSGETAKYIRSSRAGAVKNSSSTTTMIKTFRVAKSYRQALSDKYGYQKDDDDYLLKTIRRRRGIVSSQEYHHIRYDKARLQSSCKRDMQQMSSQKQRRKVLRKRVCSNSCSTIDSSCESDYSYRDDRRFHRTKVKHCCSHHCRFGEKYNNYAQINTKTNKTKRCPIAMPSSRRNRIYYYSRSHTKSFSTSSSSSSLSTVFERRRAIKMKSKFCQDDRPCKRESECHCCNERKLCDDYKHVADTSTEEWYVENCCSPKTPTSQTNALKSMTFKTDKFSAGSETMHDDAETKGILRANGSKNISTTAHLNIEKIYKPNSKTSTTTNSLNENTSEHECSDWELQQAIKASKESYEREQKSKQCGGEKEKKEKHKVLPKKPLRKISKNQEEFENVKQTTQARRTRKNKTVTNKEDEVIKKIPKLEDKDNEWENMDLIDDNSTTTNMNRTKNQTGESSFTVSQSQAIYNSTALSSKSQAYNRQITKHFGDQEGEREKSKKELQIKLKKLMTKNSRTKNTNIYPTRNSDKLAITSTITHFEKPTSAETLKDLRSPEINSTLTPTPNEIKEITHNTEVNPDDNSDCTLVTSTTHIELPVSKIISEKSEDTQQQNSTFHSNRKLTRKGILIYTPKNRNMVPADSLTSNHYITITKEHLSKVIGEKLADKFQKYYVGRKRFNSNSAVYYIPPTMGGPGGNYECSSSDSDDDLDNLGQYGELYQESLTNAIERHDDI